MLADKLLSLSLVALICGICIGGALGGWVGSRRVADLTDLAYPAWRRIGRGALIGSIFGSFIGPKLAAIGYLLFTIISR